MPTAAAVASANRSRSAASGSGKWACGACTFSNEAGTLACEVCKHRNYITKKNRRNDPDRLELKKFCPNCGKHQAHKESR